MVAVQLQKNGNYYGRRRSDFEGADYVIVDVTPKGINAIKNAFPNTFTVYLEPVEDPEFIRKRLLRRGDMSPQEARARAFIIPAHIRDSKLIDFDARIKTKQGEFSKIALELQPMIPIRNPSRYTAMVEEVFGKGKQYGEKVGKLKGQAKNVKDKVMQRLKDKTEDKTIVVYGDVDAIEDNAVNGDLDVTIHGDLGNMGDNVVGGNLSVSKKNPNRSKPTLEEFRKWVELVNMKNKELRAFLDSDWFKVSGLTPAEAKQQGIKSGQDSFRAIIRMRKKLGLTGPKDYIKEGPQITKKYYEMALTKWTGPDNKVSALDDRSDWGWMKRQIRFNSRASAFPYNQAQEKRKGPLVKKQKTQNQPSRKLLSLWVWGHDPWRWARKHGIDNMPKCPDVPWVGMTEKRKYGKIPVMMAPRKNPSPFAVFVLAKVGTQYAATTRDDGRIGLPGGKVDPGESPETAALREATEEGWSFPTNTQLSLIHSQDVEGRPVSWYLANTVPSALTDYKEKYRGIRPILITEQQLRQSGFGNENLPLNNPKITQGTVEFIGGEAKWNKRGMRPFAGQAAKEANDNLIAFGNGIDLIRRHAGNSPKPPYYVRGNGKKYYESWNKGKATYVTTHFLIRLFTRNIVTIGTLASEMKATLNKDTTTPKKELEREFKEMMAKHPNGVPTAGQYDELFNRAFTFVVNRKFFRNMWGNKVQVDKAANINMLTTYIPKKNPSENLTPNADEIREALDIFGEAQGLESDRAMLIAGAALYMHGLKPIMNDIDAVLPGMEGITEGYVNGLELDIGGGPDFTPEMLEYEVKDGVRYQTLPAILAFYKMLNREKDQVWISKLSSIIESRDNPSASYEGLDSLYEEEDEEDTVYFSFQTWTAERSVNIMSSPRTKEAYIANFSREWDAETYDKLVDDVMKYDCDDWRFILESHASSEHKQIGHIAQQVLDEWDECAEEQIDTFGEPRGIPILASQRNTKDKTQANTLTYTQMKTRKEQSKAWGLRTKQLLNALLT